jgi:hypothetical protein
MNQNTNHLQKETVYQAIKKTTNVSYSIFGNKNSSIKKRGSNFVIEKKALVFIPEYMALKVGIICAHPKACLQTQ